MARSKQEPDGVRSADIRSRDEDVEGHSMHRGGEADGAKSALTRSSLTRSSPTVPPQIQIKKRIFDPAVKRPQ